MIVLPCRSRVQQPQETESVSKCALHGFSFLSEVLVSWLLTSASQYKNHVYKLNFFCPFLPWKTFSCLPVFTLFFRDQGLNSCLSAPLLSSGLYLPFRNCKWFKQPADVQVALDRLKIIRSCSITACFSLSSC